MYKPRRTRTVESDIWLATEVCEAFMVFAETAPTGLFQVPAEKLAVGNLAVPRKR
jgi:hypothetical protein